MNTLQAMAVRRDVSSPGNPHVLAARYRLILSGRGLATAYRKSSHWQMGEIPSAPALSAARPVSSHPQWWEWPLSNLGLARCRSKYGAI